MKKQFSLFAFAFCATFLFAISGCSDNPAENQPVPVNPNPVSYISGRIANWDYGKMCTLLLTGFDGSTDKELLCSSSLISPDGWFYFTGLKAPQTQRFWMKVMPNLHYSEVVENTLVCSDTSALFNYGRMKILNKNGEPTSLEVKRRRFSDDSDYYYGKPYAPSDFDVDYLYADKDVTLKGFVKERLPHSKDNQERIGITEYDLSYKKGWNILVTYYSVTVEQLSDGRSIETMWTRYSHFEQASAVWYYYRDVNR